MNRRVKQSSELVVGLYGCPTDENKLREFAKMLAKLGRTHILTRAIEPMGMGVTKPDVAVVVINSGANASKHGLGVMSMESAITLATIRNWRIPIVIVETGIATTARMRAVFIGFGVHDSQASTDRVFDLPAAVLHAYENYDPEKF